MNTANEEVSALREKVREVQAVSKLSEKNFKKQQEYLANLNHQYTLVCNKIGIPTNFTFAKMEELNDQLELIRGEKIINNTSVQLEARTIPNFEDMRSTSQGKIKTSPEKIGTL